jgi:hypothetical protein
VNPGTTVFLTDDNEVPYNLDGEPRYFVQRAGDYTRWLRVAPAYDGKPFLRTVDSNHHMTAHDDAETACAYLRNAGPAYTDPRDVPGMTDLIRTLLIP